MSVLTQIVKSEPTTEHDDISTSSNSQNPPENTDVPNSTQLSLLSSLPSTTTHTPSTTQHPNPFGPSYTHNKSIHHTIPPFPPPFSNHPIPPMPNIYPPHAAYAAPPMPFQPQTHPHSPYPIPNPMFYPPVFHYNQRAPPPSHHTYTDNSETKTTHESSTTPVPPTKNTQETTHKSKPYSFTPGMQPGAYYLIPLNTPNGHASANQNNGHAYMPLINGGNTNDKEHNKNISDTSSATSSDSDSDSESDEQTGAVTHGVYQTPFLNVPHLPFPVPLTPNNTSFPPPPLPLPYDLNHLNSTQFSLAPIINTTNNRVLPEKNEDKKNILSKRKNARFMQPIHINNIAPLSFPPLPTNTMNHAHLNSNFAGLDADESEDIDAILTPQRDDSCHSSDQDMDVALCTHQMPIIQNNNNSLYHNITPFNAKNKKKRKTRSKSPKKTKTHRKNRRQRKKVSNKISNSNNYQAISVTVNVPALNKMNVSPAKLSNGRRMVKKRNKSNKKAIIPVANDIPDLSDNDILIPPAITNIESVDTHDGECGAMDVAYSQQYPQVGFPFIYNAQNENGKKFTCKFMDSSVSNSPQFCDRQFGQKCHWMRHCLEKHVPTEMSQRYQCRYCNMKYAQNSSLKEHVAICHSNKPPSFKCPYCSGEITFTRWTSVLRHCRNQHPDQEEPSKQLRANSLTAVVKKKSMKKKRRMRRSGGGDDDDSLMDIDGSTCNLGAMNMNIMHMPAVNMNISMNQMLSNNYIANVGVVPANVAILPPDLSHSNGHNGVR